MIKLITIVLLFPTQSFAENDCLNWLVENEILPGSKNCEIKCATVKVDMGTFHCPNQCEDLCKTVISKESLEKYVDTSALTEAEVSLVAKYPKDALSVYEAKNQAQKSTQRLFGRGRWNDEGDAFRHFMWSGLMTKAIGEKKAKAFLDAHEARPNQAPGELNMDNANNSSGIKTASKMIENKKFSVEALEKIGIQKLKSKELKVIRPTGKVPEWTK